MGAGAKMAEELEAVAPPEEAELAVVQELPVVQVPAAGQVGRVEVAAKVTLEGLEAKVDKGARAVAAVKGVPAVEELPEARTREINQDRSSPMPATIRDEG